MSDWSSDVCSSDLNLKGQEAVLVFSGPNNFRKEVWEDYKANRKASRKPLCYWTIIDHLRAEGRYRVLSEDRSEEHTSELQSLMRISYAVFCLKKKNTLIVKIYVRVTRYIQLI